MADGEGWKLRRRTAVLVRWWSALRGKGKHFFFEKKKQKTFVCLGFGLSGWAQPK
jgi:hypothetical protein